MFIQFEYIREKQKEIDNVESDGERVTELLRVSYFFMNILKDVKRITKIKRRIKIETC